MFRCWPNSSICRFDFNLFSSDLSLCAYAVESREFWSTTRYRMMRTRWLRSLLISLRHTTEDEWWKEKMVRRGCTCFSSLSRTSWMKYDLNFSIEIDSIWWNTLESSLYRIRDLSKLRNRFQNVNKYNQMKFVFSLSKVKNSITKRENRICEKFPLNFRSITFHTWGVVCLAGRWRCWAVIHLYFNVEKPDK